LLTAGQIRWDGNQQAFFTERAKTDKPVGGLLSKRMTRLQDAYLAELRYDILDNAPLLRIKGLEKTTAKGGRPRPGAPHTKNSLAEEFRRIRIGRVAAALGRSGEVQRLDAHVAKPAVFTIARRRLGTARLLAMHAVAWSRDKPLEGVSAGRHHDCAALLDHRPSLGAGHPLC
jgi:hypothetical protein